MKSVNYRDFGAAGDGIQDDFAAIAAAHAYANEHGLPVEVHEGTYYINEVPEIAVIRTPVDWTGATIIIDDTHLADGHRKTGVFRVAPDKPKYTLPPMQSVARFQKKLDLTLPEPSVVRITDETTHRYLRGGSLANSGSPQTDILIVDTDGSIDPASPVMWEYKQVTSVEVFPMDAPMTIRGGHIITRTLPDIPLYEYYVRNLRVQRSNVTLEGILHTVEGEGENGAPYDAMISVSLCANVTLKDCVFTPHRIFRYRGKDEQMHTAGTYDLGAAWAVNLTIDGCSQTVDIKDGAYWGVMCSNYCKNTLVKNSSLSRFDAHEGVANVTIRDSELGISCVETIGIGTFLMENTTLYGYSCVALRPDYGSHWEGDMILRGCKWIPRGGRPLTTVLPVISGRNTENHDFGYPCTMPHTILLEDLFIDDSNAAEGGGICLFEDINPFRVSEEYEKKTAGTPAEYRTTDTLILRNVRTASGRECALSTNPFMFRSVRIVKE